MKKCFFVNALVGIVFGVFASLAANAEPIIIHVAPDGTGDGTSWDSPMALEDAVAALNKSGSPYWRKENEIWLKAGVYTKTSDSPNFAIWSITTIRGGFDGTEESESQRKPGVVSTIDGGNLYDTFSFSNYARVTFERVRFYRSKRSGLLKWGSTGDVAIFSCFFEANGTQYTSAHHGRGLHLEGSTAGETATISNCVFAGNVDTKIVYDSGYGGGAFFQKMKRVNLTDCLFATNGFEFARTAATSVREVGGAAFYSSQAPVAVRNCRFVGNTSFFGNGGGIVWLANACGGSYFDHCVWSGNREAKGVIADTGKAGMLVMTLDSSASTVAVTNCTIAYNICGTVRGAAGVSVTKGALQVHNSIFYGNVVPSSSTADNDIQVVGGDGSATVDYSMIDHLPTSAACSNMTIGEPQFVTPLSDFLACIEAESPAYPKTNLDPTAFAYKADKLGDLFAFDFHCLSTAGYYKNDGQLYKDAPVTSSAIDTGDPDCLFDNEGDPNGGRINLGFYGNTSEAALSSVAQPALDEKNVTIAWVDGWSQPEVTVTLEDGEDYNATVKFSLGTDGETWPENDSIGGVKPAQTVKYKSPNFFEPTGRLYIRVVVTAPGAEDITVCKDVPVEGTIPPWAGKGGDPEHIIHLRAGAKGANDGTSWTDAYADFADALKALTATRNEIWIAGTNVLTQTSTTLLPNFPVTFRGGFDSSENSADQRKAGVESAIDGADTYVTLVLNNWQPILVDRLCVRRSAKHGIAKYGAGALTLTGCRFEANATKITGYVGIDGRGVHIEGTAGATDATVENCIFEGNVDGYGAYDSGYGGALYLARLRKATISNCLFVTNGFDWARTVSTSTRNFGGAAVYADGAPVRMTQCQFVGNTAFSSSGGGIVRLVNDCGGSVFDHCLWVGNRETKGSGGLADAGLMGMLVVQMADVNRSVAVEHCTFAYNLCGTVTGAAGVSVVSGTAAITNSIFYGNIIPATGAGDNDIQVVGENGRAIVSYSNLDHAPSTATCDNLAIGNPRFVTTLDEFLLCIDAENPSYPKLDVSPTEMAFKTDSATFATLMAIDVHERSVTGYYKNNGLLYKDASRTSAAVDAGNPSSDFSCEPSPNGGRVNAGYYGNTSCAAHGRGGFTIYIR